MKMKPLPAAASSSINDEPLDCREKKAASLEDAWDFNNKTPQHTQALNTQRMVGLGFRCWVRGLQTRDNRFFDVCSRQYIQNFGLKDGVVLSTRLGFWVNALTEVRKRPFTILDVDAPGFSHDEAVAISMIAASQHAECPALQACIYAITEAQDTKTAQHTAQDFADGLIDAGRILPSASIAYPLHHLAQKAGGPGALAH